MDVHVVVAPVFGTNCCVVVAAQAHDDGRRDCVVVDPGAGTAGQVDRLVSDQGLVPRAVLVTHGHVDHTWDAAELCDRYDVPLRLHAADAYRVADPFGTIGLGAALDAPAASVSEALVEALDAYGVTPRDFRAPGRVEPFDGAVTDLTAGDVRLRALHAPGHTEGSTLYLLDGPAAADADAEVTGVVLTGDVLFAGGVGRTDLPGADVEAMLATLRDVVPALPPRHVVLPGHGPTSTVARELATNPFLPR
ncbi:glyoxylase-like metal-dependent hydrolase (beta-lactamase superfamily II) [Isoptericola jiangsuensis]|uniref:Glyoxylase-like metal-dependent hydrolase (Beta-lactamase superfamily II) n=1 Tax=Isoptericola jiangsuensis TaxID=548579 RepID=A0A2A9EW88_9MICO|nr:MBL fold metallo-hydrolase [Isoptericola jiangsuensis]PFG43294.1 glyoxylase-like metal-dependent hydrolase (beta-lactamase superfamily II) [Isoptericola jiangsuensis]